jgi:hypothetical protein
MRIRTTPPTHEQQQPPPQIGSDIKEEREEEREGKTEKRERERDGIVGARASATGVREGTGRGTHAKAAVARLSTHAPGPPPSAAPAMPSPVAACPYYLPVVVPTTLRFSRVCPPDSSCIRGFEKTRCITVFPFPPSVTFF